MKPGDIAKDSEASHQTALFAWINSEIYKGHVELKKVFHIPNGDSRGDSDKSRAIAGGRLKAQGVRSGVPDIFVALARLGYHGLWIEMKKPSQKSEKNLTAGCSETQLEWIDDLKREGYAVFVAYSWLEARDGILMYLGGDNN